MSAYIFDKTLFRDDDNINPVSALSFITIVETIVEARNRNSRKPDDFIQLDVSSLPFARCIRSCFLSVSYRTSRQHKTEISDDREFAYVHSSLRSAADSHVPGTGVPRSSFQVYKAPMS